MNKAMERHKKLYREAIIHLSRLKYAFSKLKENQFLPLDSEKINLILKNEELIPILDQIVYRYSKLQDILAKLIRSYLYLKGENVENIPLIDVLNLAEKFGLNMSKEK